jgi:hypothetical protein
MMPKEDLELSILVTAQEFVDGWLHSPKRAPFMAAVGAAAKQWLVAVPLSGTEQKAFIRVAHAIRLGRGHARANPEPLLEIVRRVFEREQRPSALQWPPPKRLRAS